MCAPNAETIGGRVGEPRATLKTGYSAALLALALVGYFGWLLAGQPGSATLWFFADTDTLMVVVAAGAAFTTAVSARLTRGRVPARGCR